MVSLSLTSMVDMFAILVIFLLTTATTVSKWIEVSHHIELPKAKLVDPPQKAATIEISKDGIFGDDTLLVAPNAMAAPDMGAIKKWLSQYDKKDGFVNIVAHTKIAFGVVRKVVLTCQDSGFGKVNLAVQPRGK
jgi:biopolymer transport protein ExbD